MRLIGIGLLAFLLAGLALLLARSEMVGHSIRTLQTLTDGPQLRFETPQAAEAHDGAFAATILRAGPEAPLILSGLPAYQGAVFHMPIDARPTSGYLQIDVTSQVLEGVEGILRVSIDNTRRAEMLLLPGEVGRSMRIELTADDIARAQLVVSFSLQGTGANSVCSSNHGVEAVVEIETTSALILTLDAPLESPRDQVAAWGDQLRVLWDGQAHGLLQAVDATRSGAQVVFMPQNGLTSTEAEVALASRVPSVRPEFGWSEAMSETGALYGLRRFQLSERWRVSYDPSIAENPILPDALALSMFLARSPQGADWLITITLDDRLLDHVTVQAGQSHFDRRIALPVELDGGPHTIEITATSTAMREGPCDDGPELLAEILPQTRMIPSDIRVQSALSTLTAALAEQARLTVTAVVGLNTAEASVASELLDVVLPEQNLAISSNISPSIRVLPRGAVLPDAPSGNVWLVYRSTIDNTLIIERFSAHSNPETIAVTLLIETPEAAT